MIFPSTVAVFASLLLAPSFVLASPRAQSASASTSVPATTPKPSPAEALETAFRNLRASKESSLAAVVTTRNELLDGNCAPIIVLFARGTTEPGNVGDDVGPQFFDQLSLLRPGKVIVQGTNDYPASIWDYLLGGSDTAAVSMASQVVRAAAQCSTSKIVLSGFSQGGQVVHKAADLIPASLYPLIGAIVIFGDPDLGETFPGSLNANLKSFCHFGDLICEAGLPIPLPPHSTYEDDAPEAAAFVASRL